MRRKLIFLLGTLFFTIFYFHLKNYPLSNNLISHNSRSLDENEILHLVKYNFTTKHNEKESEDPITYLLLNDIIIPITFGTPNQTINTSLRFNDYPFFISSPSIKLQNEEEENNIFLKNKSSTYIFLGKDSLFYKSQLVEAERANDTFYFSDNDINHNNINISNFSFYYASRMIYNQSGGVVGLCLEDSNMNLHSGMNFLTQLKKNKIISYKTFFINYKDIKKEEGEFIIGAFPHEYLKEEYKYEYLHEITGYVDNVFKIYGFIFDEINLGKNKIKLKFDNKSNGNKKLMTADLQIEFGFIIAPSDLETNITKEFIDLYKCNAHITSNQEIFASNFYIGKNYKYYSCDISYSINSKLSFIHKEMEYIFELDENDLFMTYGNKKYFNILFFNNRHQSIWIFGKPFFLKYKWVFDPDNKKLGLYDNKIINKKDNSNSDNNLTLIIIIICLVFIFLIVLGIFIYIFFIQKLRKKRKNELSDDYVYENENDANAQKIVDSFE